jgi:hypothetical protein
MAAGRVIIGTAALLLTVTVRVNRRVDAGPPKAPGEMKQALKPIPELERHENTSWVEPSSQ